MFLPTIIRLFIATIQLFFTHYFFANLYWSVPKTAYSVFHDKSVYVHFLRGLRAVVFILNGTHCNAPLTIRSMYIKISTGKKFVKYS